MLAIFKEDRLTRPLYRSARNGRARRLRTNAGTPRETQWQASPRRPSGFLRGVYATLREWRRRRNGRLELARLDERILRDIGLTRVDAESEINKPFWRE
jgi:uncharacterized protein YjiS (DUF1127 family)